MKAFFTNMARTFWCLFVFALQIFPKPYDLFNLSLYGSMVVLSLCAHDWMLTYIGLLTNGGNAIFMWVSQWHNAFDSSGAETSVKLAS